MPPAFDSQPIKTIEGYYFWPFYLSVTAGISVSKPMAYGRPSLLTFAVAYGTRLAETPPTFRQDERRGDLETREFGELTANSLNDSPDVRRMPEQWQHRMEAGASGSSTKPLWLEEKAVWREAVQWPSAWCRSWGRCSSSTNIRKLFIRAPVERRVGWPKQFSLHWSCCAGA